MPRSHIGLDPISARSTPMWGGGYIYLIHIIPLLVGESHLPWHQTKHNNIRQCTDFLFFIFYFTREGCWEIKKLHQKWFSRHLVASLARTAWIVIWKTAEHSWGNWCRESPWWFPFLFPNLFYFLASYQHEDSSETQLFCSQNNLIGSYKSGHLAIHRFGAIVS